MALPSLEDVVAQIEEQAPKTPAPEESETPPAVEGKVEKTPEPEEDSETPPVDDPKPETVKKDPAAAKFAALARREREARQRQAEIERTRAEIEERSKKIEERERAISAARRPSEVLKAHGLSYADVTQDMLGNYKEPEKDPVDEKVSSRLTPLEEQNKALETKLAKLEATLAEVQSERAENARRSVVNEIIETAKENGHEILLQVGDEAYVLVQHLINDYFKTHKKVLTYKEACDKVEDYYASAVLRLADTPKMRKQLAPRFASETPAAKSVPKKEAAEKPNTLTQSLTQGVRAKTSSIDKLPRHEALNELAKQLKYKD